MLRKYRRKSGSRKYVKYTEETLSTIKRNRTPTSHRKAEEKFKFLDDQSLINGNIDILKNQDNNPYSLVTKKANLPSALHLERIMGFP